MGVLSTGRERWAFGPALAAVAAVLLLGACRQPQPLVLTQRDSTHTERVITYRDTVVRIPADAATLRLGTEAQDMARLVDELRGEVRIIRGTNQAALRLSADRDSLTVVALCDELQVKFDSVLVENRTLQYVQQATTAFLAARPEQNAPMPAWAKGVALAGASVAGLLLVAALLPALKHILNGKA